MKKTLAFLLVLLIFLTGCHHNNPADSNPADSTAPSQTQPQTQTPDTKPVISPGPVVTTRPTEPTVPDGVKNFQELFTAYYNGNIRNFYNIATLSTFSNPKELNMREILYNGIGGVGDHTLTDEELAHFTAIDPTHAFVDTSRMRPEEIDAILTLYFDITLEDINKEGKENLMYWEETDCYYTFYTDLHRNSSITVTDCKEGEDGTVQVFYKTMYQEADSYVMTLKKVNQIYKILSNLPIE